MFPSDPYILLSFVNTALRDEYGSLEDLCAEKDGDPDEIVRLLKNIGYRYDPKQNKFV